MDKFLKEILSADDGISCGEPRLIYQDSEPSAGAAGGAPDTPEQQPNNNNAAQDTEKQRQAAEQREAELKKKLDQDEYQIYESLKGLADLIGLKEGFTQKFLGKFVPKITGWLKVNAPEIYNFMVDETPAANTQQANKAEEAEPTKDKEEKAQEKVEPTKTEPVKESDDSSSVPQNALEEIKNEFLNEKENNLFDQMISDLTQDPTEQTSLTELKGYLHNNLVTNAISPEFDPAPFLQNALSGVSNKITDNVLKKYITAGNDVCSSILKSIDDSTTVESFRREFKQRLMDVIYDKENADFNAKYKSRYGDSRYLLILRQLYKLTELLGYAMIQNRSQAQTPSNNQTA